MAACSIDSGDARARAGYAAARDISPWFNLIAATNSCAIALWQRSGFEIVG